MYLSWSNSAIMLSLVQFSELVEMFYFSCLNIIVTLECTRLAGKEVEQQPRRTTVLIPVRLRTPLVRPTLRANPYSQGMDLFCFPLSSSIPDVFSYFSTGIIKKKMPG